MPSKRKTPSTGTFEPTPSAKRVRTRTEDENEHKNGDVDSRLPVGEKETTAGAKVAKRGPGRPRRNTVEISQVPAPSTPKITAAVAAGRRKIAATTSKKSRAPLQPPPAGPESQTKEALEAAEDEEEDEPELPPPLDSSSSDPLSVNPTTTSPTTKRRPKPKITYKSRRPSDSFGDEDIEDGRALPLEELRYEAKGARSSPVKGSGRSVDVVEPPATAVKEKRRARVYRRESVVEEVVEVVDEVDSDEDVVGADGKVAPAAAQEDKERENGEANRRRSTPTPAKKTVELEGIEDPFAILDESPSKAKTPKPKPQKGQKRHDQDALKVLKKKILPKLMGRERPKLIGVEEEEAHVRKLLTQTVTAGEGNSMLIVGARGCGKTTMVENIISDLKSSHPTDFLTVRLSGFHQTDDRTALREIWRQLGVEMELDASETTKTSSFADTLTSILALLSHPDELQNPDEDDEGGEEAAADKTTLSVVFILDEFDLFTTHPRQTLLYNLFDIAQSRKAPIAVIGTTTRIDITDCLEKRVKSRFSHRTVHLTPPRTVEKFWDIIKSSLAIDDSEEHQNEIFEKWNAHVDALYEDSSFQSTVRRVYARSADVRTFLNTCILPVSTLPQTGFPLASAFTPALAEPDSILSILDGLTDLELTMLIAAARLDIISGTETCNFAMAYDEYATLVGGVKVAAAASGVVAGRVWGREVAKGAWESLGKYGLVSRVGKGMGLEGMWRVEVGLGEIGGVVERGGAGGGRGGVGKWCREI